MASSSSSRVPGATKAGADGLDTVLGQGVTISTSTMSQEDGPGYFNSIRRLSGGRVDIMPSSIATGILQMYLSFYPPSTDDEPMGSLKDFIENKATQYVRATDLPTSKGNTDFLEMVLDGFKAELDKNPTGINLVDAVRLAKHLDLEFLGADSRVATPKV